MIPKKTIEFMCHLAQFTKLSQDDRIFINIGILFFIVHKYVFFLEIPTEIDPKSFCMSIELEELREFFSSCLFVHQTFNIKEPLCSLERCVQIFSRSHKTLHGFGILTIVFQ